MSTPVVRRLLVDMEKPIARHWCGGDAFRTAFFNALSMSFPVGEQFFIDAVRGGFKALPAQAQQHFGPDVQVFVGQEATHRRLHGLYNQQLERQGLVNEWEGRARDRMTLLEGRDIRHWLAITAANEHLTAIFAEWILRHPQCLGEQDERLRTMWLWHSAEESEHRSTAFDLYRALGGDDAWRLRWFRRVSLIFVADAVRQTLVNLRCDGTLWKASTWRGAAAFLLGREGLVAGLFRPWRDYRRAGFHPGSHDGAAAREWLQANRSSYTAVGS